MNNEVIKNMSENINLLTNIFHIVLETATEKIVKSEKY